MIVTEKITLIFPELGSPSAGMSCFIEREHSFNGQMNVAKSHMLICPKCKHKWAELELYPEDGQQELLWPVAQTCENCSIEDEWMPVPGSLLVEEGWGIIDDSLLAALPEELLRREFWLHIKAYERQATWTPSTTQKQDQLRNHGEKALTSTSPTLIKAQSEVELLDALGETKMEASQSG